MAVKIRLTRIGKKKQPTYRVVVVDSRKPRDGAFIEQIGRYDPRQEPSLVEIDNERALVWLRNGAQPTDRAKKLLEISGAWTRFRIDKGDIHTISTPAEPVAEAPVTASGAGDEDEAAAATSETAPSTEDAVEPAGEPSDVAAASAETTEETTA